MGRSRGFQATMALKEETVYGTAPSGDYNTMPFITSDLGSEQPLIEAPEVGLGRDPQDPVRDVISAGGPVVIPVELRNIGFWLKGIFGAPVTGEDSTGKFLHSYRSGFGSVAGEVLPSYSVEVGHPNVPAFFMNSGIRFNSMALDFQRSGPAQATMETEAQGEVRNATSQAGSPTSQAFKRFNQFNGRIRKDGAPLANVTAATLVYNNNIERIDVIRNDALIEDVDPNIAACTGTIDVRFADTDLLALAESFTPLELELAYVIDGDQQLVWTMHRVFLPKAKQPITGAGGVQATFAWQSADDPVIGRMVTVDLFNDVSAY